MNTLTIVIIAIVALYLIYVILATIFVGLVEIINKSIDGLKKAVIYTFGKKYLKRRAKIPKELLPDSKPLPTKDPQLLSLKKYHPKSSYLEPIKAIRFKSDSECLTDPHTENTKRFFIEKLPDLLVLSPPKCYEGFFNIIYEEPDYPGLIPQEPIIVTPPPRLQEWKIKCDKPSFNKPRWPFILGFLNGFVDKAYESEITSFKSAEKKYENLVDQCKYRNANVRALAQKAENLYKKIEGEQTRQYSDQLWHLSTRLL